MIKTAAICVCAALLLSAACLTAFAQDEQAQIYSEGCTYTLYKNGLLIDGTNAETSFLGNKTDFQFKLLTDGVTVEEETKGSTVVLTGALAQFSVVLDLGETKDGITAVKFLGVRDTYSANGGNRGFDVAKTSVYFGEAENELSKVDYDAEKVTVTGEEYKTVVYQTVPSKARYVKLEFSSPAFCLALSEIQIEGVPGKTEDNTSAENSEITNESFVTEQSKPEQHNSDNGTEISAQQTEKVDDGSLVKSIVIIVITVITTAAVVGIIYNKRKEVMR